MRRQTAHGHVIDPIEVKRATAGGRSLEDSRPQRKDRPRPRIRFPHLGPGAIGACVLGAYAVGWFLGPMAGLGGAILGMIAGDLLDQSQEHSFRKSN